ncbi:MAG: hypothetical protein JWQ38_1095 [Flavipsychrobacter sp.]|nr:hypothetical protein [Flavipsychrobacter sp.]
MYLQLINKNKKYGQFFALSHKNKFNSCNSYHPIYKHMHTKYFKTAVQS